MADKEPTAVTADRPFSCNRLRGRNVRLLIYTGWLGFMLVAGVCHVWQTKNWAFLREHFLALFFCAFALAVITAGAAGAVF